MKNWKELYDAKKMTSDEAAQLIKSYDKVVFQHDVGEPAELVRAMVRNAKNYKHVEISHMFSLGPGDYCKEEYKENFHPNMWFISGQTRKACNYWGDYTTFFFHELPELMRQGRVQVDVVLIQVSKPDKLGYVSTGVSGDYTVQAIRSAKTVIAQVNEHVPFTYGDVVFPLMEPDFLLINNLTRDSIMRNGHPEYISRVLTRAMPAKTKLILNGDDLIASNVAPGNPRAYYGIESLPDDVQACINLVNDLQICPKCHSLLQYTNRRYHHIGRAFCPECGFRSPKLDYTGADVNNQDMTFEVSHGDWKHRFRILNDSVFNIRSAATGSSDRCRRTGMRLAPPGHLTTYPISPATKSLS